jgi:hypothetical protein
MVTPADGVDASTLAAALGVELLRAPGPGGVAVLGLPEGTTPEAFIGQLRLDTRIASASPLGRTYAAGKDGSEDYTSYQWHLDAIDTSAKSTTSGLSDVVVAVADSGVAYETTREFTAATTLSKTTFVSPWDFINDDAHPNDDSGHGTHVTSLIASSGAVAGVAAGVTVMPIKVLDADNTGDEAALIDGITWATQGGADVLNMSLTFAPGYSPSPALLAAIGDALDAGMILVAAAGNDAESRVGWPAAARGVIAVGASTMSSADAKYLTPTDYSNLGLRLDVLAPGGDLDADSNGDGLPDGILAESIDPDDPTSTGFWWMTGTSQSTALVTGTVARMLASGSSQRQVFSGLHQGSKHVILEDDTGTASKVSDPLAAGLGTGVLSVSGAISEALSGNSESLGAPLYAVASIPYIQDNGDGTVSPALWMMAFDDSGATAKPTLFVTFSGSTGGWASCTPDESLSCTVTGPAADPDDDPAWLVSVDAVVVSGLPHRPGTALLATDSLEILLAALAEEPELNGDELLALHFADGTDDMLGDVAESYVLMNTGTGLADSPIGPLSIILSPRLIDGCGSCTDLELDLDGTGLADSPIGPLSVRILSGTGLADSPIGPLSFRLVIIEGTGLADSPIGPLSFLGGSEPLRASAIDHDGAVILMSEGLAPMLSLEGTATGDWLEAGGGLTEAGYPAASAAQSVVVED